MSRRHEFGTKLREYRERRGTSLEAISRDTKVSLSLFTALEQGNCSRWPPGVYSRAYVRSYADAIGLSGAEVVAEFCECFPEVALPADAADAEDRRARDAGANTPLTLTFAGRPQRWRTVRRVFGALCDLLLIGLGALMLAVGGGFDFWMALAAVGLAWHLLSSALPHRSVVESLTDTSSRRWLAKRRASKVVAPKEDDASVETLPADALGAGLPILNSVVHSRQ
jgi:transcriptional regulator with XRE-family HTH domain